MKQFSPGESTPMVTPFLSDRERERLDRIDRLEGQLYQHVKAYMRPKTRERWCVRSMARITAELTSLYSAI